MKLDLVSLPVFSDLATGLFVKDCAESVFEETKPPAVELSERGNVGFTAPAIARPHTTQVRLVHPIMPGPSQFISNTGREYFHAGIFPEGVRPDCLAE
jgi:hypothetical protein